DVSKTIGSNPDSYHCHYKVTPHGFNEYAETYIKGYSEIFDRTVSSIVNEELETNIEVQANIEEPIYLINKILDLLNLNGDIGLTKTVGGKNFITHISASLRRKLE